MNFNIFFTNLIIVSLLFSCSRDLLENNAYIEPINCDTLTKDIYTTYETAIVSLIDSNRIDTINLKHVDSLVCLMDSSCKYYPQMIILKYKISIELCNYSSGISYLENTSDTYFSNSFSKKLAINHLKLLALLEESKYKELNELRDQTQNYLKGFIHSKDSILINCYVDGLNTIDLNVSQVNNIIYNLKKDKGSYSKDVYEAKLSNYHNIIVEPIQHRIIGLAV